MSEVGIYVMLNTVLTGTLALIWDKSTTLNITIKMFLSLSTVYGALLMFVRGVW